MPVCQREGEHNTCISQENKEAPLSLSLINIVLLLSTVCIIKSVTRKKKTPNSSGRFGYFTTTNILQIGGYISNDFCVSIMSAIFHNNNNVTGNKSCKLRLSTHNNNKLCSSEAGVIVSKSQIREQRLH
jgi:hypothetical protein